MAGGGSYGAICGVFVNDKRCYARANARYGNRCKEHEGLVHGRDRPPSIYRCGWQRTFNGLRCCNMVTRDGERCPLHTRERITAADARWRADQAEAAARRRTLLETRLERKLEQQRLVEADIGVLRAALAVTETEAATEDRNEAAE